MSDETARPSCPTCGAPLPANAPELLCPRCLGNAALLGDNESGPGSGIEVPGDQIERYRLLEKIGEGGFGSVYMAEQREPVTRKVALKILKLGMDTKQVIARFDAERQALALMDHPNIARILDGGATDSGRPYFVMELVRGVPITQFCEENHADRDERLRLFLDACIAVQHAHQKGIIHRDLKPNNILVTMNDDRPLVKIIDFGIAKAVTDKLTDQTLFTQFHQFVGTPAYMSPEQAQLNATDVDTRTDIYALGVMLYELLTGTTPFDPDKLRTEGQEAVFRMIREEDPPRPSTRITELKKQGQTRPTPGIPHSDLERDLDWVVMRALEKDRRRRYETANGLAQDVKRFLDHEPVSAAAPSLIYQMRKWFRRHRAAAVTGAAVLASLLAGLVIATTFYWREREARVKLVEANYAKDMQSVAYAFDRGRASLARSTLEKHIPKAGETNDQREWLWRYHMGQLHRDYARSALFEKGAMFFAVAPDGHMMARILNDGVQFLTVPEFEIAQTVSVETGWFGGFFSNDSQRFITRAKSPSVIDLSTFAVEPMMAPARLPVFRTSIPTPDGKWLLGIVRDPVLDGTIGPDRYRLVSVEVDTGRTVSRTPPLSAPNHYQIEGEIKVSPDSRYVTHCANDLSVRVFGIPELDEVARFPVQDDANGVAWSPDSRLLAIFYDYPADVELWDVRSQTHLRTLEAPFKEPKTNLTFSPDGKLLAAALWGEGLVVWNVDKGVVEDTFVTKASMVAFLPDGQLLAEGGRRIRLFNLSHGKPVTDLHSFSGASELWHLTYSPDGVFLASTARDGIVRLFDAKTEQLVHAFPSRRSPNGHRPPYGGAPLAFASDGRTLVAANGDHTVSVLDIPRREERFLLEGHTRAIDRLAISSDSEMLATTGGDTIMIVWDLKTGIELERTARSGPKPVDFSPVPGSKLLAYRDRQGFGIRDLANADGIHHYREVADRLWAVKFSPDGKLLYVGNQEDRSWIYDVATFKRVGTLPPVVGRVGLSHSPDERNLALPTWGWGTHLWQMQTGLSLGPVPFPEPGAWIHSAEFSPDGNTLAISSRKYGVHLLHAPSFEEIASWSK